MRTHIFHFRKDHLVYTTVDDGLEHFARKRDAYVYDIMSSYRDREGLGRKLTLYHGSNPTPYPTTSANTGTTDALALRIDLRRQVGDKIGKTIAKKWIVAGLCAIAFGYSYWGAM